MERQMSLSKGDSLSELVLIPKRYRCLSTRLNKRRLDFIHCVKFVFVDVRNGDILSLHFELCYLPQ